MNLVVMMGRLTKDVELRETASGVKVAQFSIAVNRNFKNAEGGYDADFFNCTAWRGTAEFISNYFKKGQEIVVDGKMSTRDWTDNEGNNRTVLELTVETAHFCGSKSNNMNTTTTTENATQGNIEGFTPIDNDDDLPF